MSRMSKTRASLMLCILCIIVNYSGGNKNYDDLPDFEFDDNYKTETKNQVSRQSISTLNFSDFDDFFIDDGSEHEPHFDIKAKEKLLKSAILRALSTKELKYKFSEVLPLLRHLSKAQRMVFSSIISAQINGGRSFTFDEVGTLSCEAFLLSNFHFSIITTIINHA